MPKDGRVDVHKRIRSLRDDIRRHEYLYYVCNTPEMTDAEFDRLMRDLTRLEEAHPDLITSDSPTQRVGGQPEEGFETVAHLQPMLSIDNTYSEEELVAFDQRARKAVDVEILDYVVEPKIDGLAVSLWYENGQLSRGVTRGDGRRGDDVTANLRTIRQIPLALRETPCEFIEVRGEVYMSDAEFARLNQVREEAGDAPFANPRNAAAGSLKLLDPRITARRGLAGFFYDVGQVRPPRFSRHAEVLDALSALGFPVNPHWRRARGIGEVIDACKAFRDLRVGLGYQVDGMVVKVDDLALWERLGQTAKSPRYMIAFKYPAEQATTRLLKIALQVGKTGVVAPVAHLEPVHLAGTTVKRASLHNADEIARKDIREGDNVIVEKAGEIIPQVVGVVTEDRTGSEEVFRMPAACPDCGSDVSRIGDEVCYRCMNFACSSQVKGRIRYYASRDNMDIEGLGDALVEQLYEAGLVKDVADLYDLRAEQLEPIERMGETSSRNLIAAIQTSKRRGLAHLISGLGIPHIGVAAARTLAAAFGSMDALKSASVEELQAIGEIGPVMAESIRRFFDNERNRRLLDRLDGEGVDMSLAESAASPRGALAGKRVVVTGALADMGRAEARRLIEAAGGIVQTGVGSKTDYLVAGEKPGSKLAKAQKLGIPVIDEATFVKLLKG